MDKEASSRQYIIGKLKALAAKLGNPPSRDEFLKTTGISKRQVVNIFGSYTALQEAAGVDLAFNTQRQHEQGVQMARIKAELKRSNDLLKEAQGEAVTAMSLRELIGSIDTSRLGENADWLRGPKKRTVSTTGTPVLFLSDIHFDEVVDPEQIQGCNEYDHEIAVERIQNTFKSAVTLLRRHMVKPRYDGIVVPLGGDLLSGNIHEELAETNEQVIAKSIFDLTDLLVTGIGNLADEFGRVFVPGVPGNHGRMHKKPRAKNRVHDNFEWLVYQYTARYFKNDSRVSFFIPDGTDAQFQIYDKTFNLNHGDQFRGGTGISGAFAPLSLGMHRKKRRQHSIGRPFDIMLIGHWHQNIITSDLVVNGSIKGYDEFAAGLNLPFEPPQQALFIMHPEKGMTFRMPVLCGSEKEKSKASARKLSVVW